MKNIIKPLAKSVLILLGLAAAASTADAGMHKKILGSGHNQVMETKKSRKNRKIDFQCHLIL